MRVRGQTIMAALAAAVTLAGCGGSDPERSAVEQLPAEGGLREKVSAAASPSKADFPAAEGRTLQEIADQIGGGPEAALATSVLTVGADRLAFGVIDPAGAFVYGKSAVYVAPTPDSVAQGPFPAPADILVTEPAYRSKQAAAESDPFAAVYEAQVRFRKPGTHFVLTVTDQGGGKLVAAPAEVKVKSKAADPIPDVGERAPRVETDTLASAKGDVESIDTRQPPSDLHEESFADLVGNKPVALLFSTPQLCQSRVCGPVTDIALQVAAKYGDRMEFIHQEVYVDNQPGKGLRPPLQAFNLRTEPWLFVVDASGRVTARLEGSFGLKAFERAVQTAL
jgi:hypothetical protein